MWVWARATFIARRNHICLRLLFISLSFFFSPLVLFSSLCAFPLLSLCSAFLGSLFVSVSLKFYSVVVGAAMDLLRAEIERKKKGLDSVGVVAKVQRNVALSSLFSILPVASLSCHAAMAGELLSLYPPLFLFLAPTLPCRLSVPLPFSFGHL